MMTRQDIEGIEIGQTGLYPWNKDLPVCEVHEVREVLVGPRAGQVFRYVLVQAPGSQIGFIVSEGD
jgi:hypothetical protein